MRFFIFLRAEEIEINRKINRLTILELESTYILTFGLLQN